MLKNKGQTQVCKTASYFRDHVHLQMTKKKYKVLVCKDVIDYLMQRFSTISVPLTDSIQKGRM